MVILLKIITAIVVVMVILIVLVIVIVIVIIVILIILMPKGTTLGAGSISYAEGRYDIRNRYSIHLKLSSLSCCSCRD